MPKIESQVAGQLRDKALWQDQISSKSKLRELGFEKLQGATLKTAKNAEALINSQELFKNYFRTEVRAMTEGMNEAHVTAFTNYAEKKLDEIVSATFGKMEERLLDGNSIKHRTAHMKEANKLAQTFLRALEPTALEQKVDDLRAELKARPRNEIPPQIVRGSDGHFNLIRTAPMIENLVLKGGGAKGIGYPPALKEMHETGMLGGLKQVVGTSAGALTAVAVSAGMSAEELEDLTNQDIKQFLKSNEDLNAVYPELSYHKQLLGIGASLFGGDAQGMVKLLDEVTADKVSEHLKSLQDGGLEAAANQYAQSSGLDPDDVLARLTALMNPDYENDRSGAMVTFSDMKMMHAIAPREFKEIQLTGYDQTSKAGMLFNAEQTPDLPVAFAARISMAHPLIASAISLDPKFGLEGHVFADGGISTNSPTEAIFGGKQDAIRDTSGDHRLQELHARTALMIFDEGGKAYSALHGIPEDRTSSANFIEKWVANNPSMSRDKQSDKDKEYSTGPNTFIVFHGEIGTLDTNASDEKKRAAQALSTLRTLEQINNRKDEAYAVEVNGVDDAFNLLSDNEKRLVVEQGPPQREDFFGPSAEENFIAAGYLHDLCQKAVGPILSS